MPRTAWGGPAPRLALPHVDPPASAPWAGAFVADGDDFRRLMEDLEPLLVSLYVAGYVVPEIAVMTEGGAPKLGVTTGRVELTDPALVRLRSDVDTEVDLWNAVRLGVGTHTAAALRDDV